MKRKVSWNSKTFMWTCSQTYFLSSHISVVDLLKPENKTLLLSLCVFLLLFFPPMLVEKLPWSHSCGLRWGQEESIWQLHMLVLIIKWDEVGHLSLILVVWQLSLLPVLEEFHVSWGGTIPLQLGPGHKPGPQAPPVQQALCLPDATPR